MAKKILQRESPILREKSVKVKPEEISGARIKKIIEEMRSALDSQDDGVAIAAPQIGYPLRIFIVSGKIEDINKQGLPEQIHIDETNIVSKARKDTIYINPTIKKLSNEKHFVEEGCLSVRYLYGQVRRSKKIIIEALDENGKKITRGGTGLLAQIFQHEIDHLEGVLFIDKAKNLEEMPPENLELENDNGEK